MQAIKMTTKVTSTHH